MNCEQKNIIETSLRDAQKDHASLVDQFDACGKLLNEIAPTPVEMRKRLVAAEARNYELNLQLKARSSESQTDGLTGLANRRSFDREFAERCIASQQSHCPLTLVILDIDHFKSVNDSFGHHVGDAVLRGIARLLKGHLPIDTLLARYGGEEFALIIDGTSIDDAIEIVEQMRRLVSETQFRYEGHPLALTISCGLAQLASREHCEQLLKRADEAMYAAKQAGRNRTFWHAGQQLQLVTSDVKLGFKCTAVGDFATAGHIELATPANAVPSYRADSRLPTTSAFSLRTTRACWCDGAMMFWNIRQRLAEWNGGGDGFCVLAIEIDDGLRIGQSYGPMALHFMMRAQLLHLDATLRDMDIVARISKTRIIVLLPRLKLSSLTPILRRLRETMDRFAFPSASELVEYSISIGVTEATKEDDPQQVVQRAELALGNAQTKGKGKFFAQDCEQSWELELESSTHH